MIYTMLIAVTVYRIVYVYRTPFAFVRVSTTINYYRSREKTTIHV